VSDRTRTGDRLDHNQELYQLSYAHRVDLQSSVRAGLRRPEARQRRGGSICWKNASASASPVVTTPTWLTPG
jgi:hypothetical protein